jgi:hypothetical protein
MTAEGSYGSKFAGLCPTSNGFGINAKESGNFCGRQQHFRLPVDLRHLNPRIPFEGQELLPFLRIMRGKYLLEGQKLQELLHCLFVGSD